VNFLFGLLDWCCISTIGRPVVSNVVMSEVMLVLFVVFVNWYMI